MQVRGLYEVPKGKKITEQHLRRVLAISICGILLCMSCLAGTTWAWFTVSVENTGNTIQIAQVIANVNIRNGDATVTESGNGSYQLGRGTYTLIVNLDNDATHTDQLAHSRCPVYVLVTVTDNQNQSKYYYLDFSSGTEQQTKELGIDADSATVSFSVSWIAPASAVLVAEDETHIGDNPTETTEPSEPGEGTSEPTEAETEPDGETTQPSEAETEPDTETTQPSEVGTESTESDTNSSGDDA